MERVVGWYLRGDREGGGDEGGKHGKNVSSAIVVWKGVEEGRKGTFVVNLSRKSKNWEEGTVKLGNIPGCELELQKDDMLIYLDVKGGYRHFYLRPEMRDLLFFRYEYRFYRCVALQFGWGRSGY